MTLLLIAGSFSLVNPLIILQGLSCFCFAVRPSFTYLSTAGVEGFYFNLITLKQTSQSVGILWTRDRPVAETST
jgi:hypothetical protein